MNTAVKNFERKNNMKIILKPKKRIQCSETLVGVIRITPEAEIILRKIQPQTDDLSLCEIASQIIVQAYEQDNIQIGED